VRIFFRGKGWNFPTTRKVYILSSVRRLPDCCSDIPVSGRKKGSTALCIPKTLHGLPFLFVEDEPLLRMDGRRHDRAKQVSRLTKPVRPMKAHGAIRDIARYRNPVHRYRHCQPLFNGLKLGGFRPRRLAGSVVEILIASGVVGRYRLRAIAEVFGNSIFKALCNNPDYQRY